MKTQKLYTILFIILSLLFTIISNSQLNHFDQTIEENVTKLHQQVATLPTGISAEWYSQAAKEVQRMEYDFYAVREEGNFQAVNNHNQLSFFINTNGYSIHKLRHKSGELIWNVDLNIKGIGRNKSFMPLDNFVAVKETGSVVYHSKPLDIQYINDTAGLRQNFIINEKPEGFGKLSINMQLKSSLTPEEKPGNKIIFYSQDNSNDVKLIYDDLKVWDADFRVLSASMELDKKTNSLSIVIDDQHAVYPITVDPLNRTPEWTTSADGILPALLTNLQLQVQTLYGYTVAGLGDINGDSYDDVAVSAPTMADVITGTGSLAGVGAVFIYLGSPSGLPVIPSKVLQPNTAVAGALFGFSVDAGDITGDGKNDIVIGAPMDSYQTTAAGLLGPTSVNVTAGKVYLYRSEDLFSAPNPSPFLQIRLQGTGFFSTGILGLLQSNVTVNDLFGFSVAVSQDLNGDNKSDIIIGSPTYLGIDLLSAQSGAAFVYYSNNLSTISPAQLNTPTPSLLGLVSLPVANTSGLLFGFSADGIGDYNNDGKPDVVVGAPAGIDLSSLGGIFSGQVLGGSAYVYYGNGSGVNSSIGVRLQAAPSGLLSNAANLFGYDVKGARNAFGLNTGNILIGAPVGSVLSNVLNGLRVKAGQVHVFKKKNSSPASPVIADQIISSPRSTSVLSILTGQTINVSLLYGSSIDNMLDVNCDGIGDIIVGEPLSTAVPLIGANVVGGSAYIYLGTAGGTYVASPFWDLTTQVSPLLGVNTTALVGYSVAGAKYVKGQSQGVRALVGGPSNSLDFGVGLLNLGNTVGTTFDFVFDNNGLGKAYAFPFTSCNIPLPATLLEFKGQINDQTVALSWITLTEDNVNFYELQRSNDGTQFETIAIVFAKDGQHNEYAYIDNHPNNGINYYRLKIVDRDNRFNFSDIITVHFNDELPGDIRITPNPADIDINVKVTGLEKGIYRFELLNSLGQLQLIKTVNITMYVQKETMSCTDRMPSGMYWLNIYNEKNNRVKSLGVFVNRK